MEGTAERSDARGGRRTADVRTAGDGLRGMSESVRCARASGPGLLRSTGIDR